MSDSSSNELRIEDLIRDRGLGGFIIGWEECFALMPWGRNICWEKKRAGTFPISPVYEADAGPDDKRSVRFRIMDVATWLLGVEPVLIIEYAGRLQAQKAA